MVGRPERSVDPNDGPVAAFAYQLRQLRRRAGNPPYRELATRAHFSHTTISDAARGERLPTLEVTLAFVKACGGDIEDWKGRWHAYHHLILAANPPKNTPAAGPAAHGQSGPSPADRTPLVLSSDDEVLESPQPRHAERHRPAPAGNRLPTERRRLMVGLATALLSFATGWQIRTVAGATATAIAQQGASTTESTSATSPESSTISTSGSGSAVSTGTLDPWRKNQQPWYKSGELPFNETFAWTYATPVAPLHDPDPACSNPGAPTLPQILSAQQKTYFSGTNPDGDTAEEEIYFFGSATDAQVALQALENTYAPSTCQNVWGDTENIQQTASLNSSTPGAAYLRRSRITHGGLAHIADDLPAHHEFLVRSGPIIGFLRITSDQAALEITADDVTVLQGLANHLAAYSTS